MKLRALAYLWWQIYKKEIKPYLKPTLLVSFILAWFLTNGWGYLLAAIGKGWVRGVALTYIGLLWLPFTPEKLITIPLAFLIQRWLFVILPIKLKLIRIKEYNYSSLFLRREKHKTLFY
jgi:hypothetical protein